MMLVLLSHLRDIALGGVDVSAARLDACRVLVQNKNVEISGRKG